MFIEIHFEIFRSLFVNPCGKGSYTFSKSVRTTMQSKISGSGSSVRNEFDRVLLLRRLKGGGDSGEGGSRYLSLILRGTVGDVVWDRSFGDCEVVGIVVAIDSGIIFNDGVLGRSSFNPGSDEIGSEFV
jgi:hypothetical protein